MKKVLVLIIAVSLGLLFTVYFCAMQKPLREYETEQNMQNKNFYKVKESFSKIIGHELIDNKK